MRFPVILIAPDGRQITCWDSEHATAVHVLTSWLIWAKVGRFVRDRDGDIDWVHLEAQAPLHASSEQLLAAAALDLYGAHNDAFEVAALKRLCRVLEAEHLARVLEAVCLLRPDAAPPGIGRTLGGQVRWNPSEGWWPVSDRAAAKAKTHLNVALMRLDEAARLAREAGLHRPAGSLERLAREAADVLGKLQSACPAALLGHPPVDDGEVQP